MQADPPYSHSQVKSAGLANSPLNDSKKVAEILQVILYAARILDT